MFSDQTDADSSQLPLNTYSLCSSTVAIYFD